MNVVDSSAWLEYFANGPNASLFARPIEEPDRLIVPTLSLFEVFERLPVSSRWATEKLHEEYELLLALKVAAEQELVAEARKQPITRVLLTAPGLGPIRVAQLIPIVVTPHCFRTRGQFWSYCGPGVVMRSSADWVRSASGS